MISYCTLVRYLHEQNYARCIPSPVPEPPDREAWIKKCEEFIPKLTALLHDEEVDVFFGDEAGFEGIRDPDNAGSNGVQDRPKDIMAAMCGRTSLVR